MQQQGDVVDSKLFSSVDDRISKLEQCVKGNYTKEFKGDISSAVNRITQQLKTLEEDNDLIRKFFQQYKLAEPAILAQNRDSLSVDAKTAIILACEESIMRTVNILKEVQRLENYVNSPNLQNIPPLMAKLKPVEALHMDQAMQASQLGEQVEEFLKSYNSIVSNIPKTPLNLFP